MGVKNCFKNALTATQAMIGDYLFKCSNRVKPEYFTRNGKLDFKETLLFMMNMVKKSLQLELNDFFETVLKRGMPVSKQAYSEARQKIEPKAFIELNDRINQVIYEECNEYELWNGYRLSAIDGSVLEIPNTELLRTEFGYVENQNGKTARAQMSCIVDVINNIVIKSKIGRYGASERDMAKLLISEMIKETTKRELILFDRGYPSADFVSFLLENRINFVMRAKVNFSTTVINAKKADQIIEIKHHQKTYLVRVLRILLPSGIEEILLTSLLGKEFTSEDFKSLYSKRWGIETKFDEIKNRLELTNFTGTTKIAIEQDFYVTIYLSNMIELARQQSDEVIEDRNEDKCLKHEYKTNLNILIGTLKDKFILMMLEESSRKRNKMFKEIMDQVAKSIVPIRSGRQNKRQQRLLRTRYKTNQKRCL
jgi:IS4 transposase